MTDRRGAVFDLGYVPHEGVRLGRSGAIRTTIKDGVRRVLGLRRKARKKILPWLLFAIAMLPAVVFVGLAFFLSTFAPEAESPFGGHADYYDLSGSVTLLFIALAGPELLIPDRVQGVLAVYSSRPLSARDYLLSRAGALTIVVAGFLIVPQLLMYVGFAALDPGGFTGALVSNWPELWRILATSAALLVGYGVPALIVAVYAKRLAPATGVYLAIMFIATGLAAGISESASFSGARYAALLAVAQHPFVIRDWVFDQFSDTVPAAADFSPWMSVGVLGAMLVIGSVLALRRYRDLL